MPRDNQIPPSDHASAMEPSCPVAPDRQAPAIPADCAGSTSDILRFIELGCWFALALAPLLYWVNGAAVSTDQLVFRSALVGFALGAAIALRLAKLVARQELPPSPRR